MPTTIKTALADAAEFLRDNSVRDARSDAQILLGKVLNQNLTFLIARDDTVLSAEQFAEFYRFVKRRANGEPVQHLVGKQEFYGLDFEVNENVLIPRPETEFLVEAALEILQTQATKTFCDVGTGSGAVAVAIAKNLPEAKGVAGDVSARALAVARRNAIKNQVENQLQFIESDVFDAFRDSRFAIHDSRFAVVVSNPPYIPNSDSAMLQREVRDFEPHVALFGGADGLQIVEKLLRDAPAFLLPNGFLLFEIGFTQSERVQQLIDRSVWHLREIRHDLQGIPRTVVLQLKSETRTQ